MTPEEKKQQGYHINKSIEYRGKILNMMTLLEFMLNAYIARYFCGEDLHKIEKMVLLVLGDDRITLSSKAQIFHQIAIKEDKEWYDRYVSNRKIIKPKSSSQNMNNDLNYVIQERNVFAHRIIAFDDVYPFPDRPTDTIRFVRFKNDLEPLDYTKEKFDELYLVIAKLAEHFSNHEGIRKLSLSS